MSPNLTLLCQNIALICTCVVGPSQKELSQVNISGHKQASSGGEEEEKLDVQSRFIKKKKAKT